MQVGSNKVVTIDYTLTSDDGTVIDSSKGGEPLTYLHGVGSLIPGLEGALEGKSAGDALQVALTPAQGYGERDEQLMQVVRRDMFEGEALEVGMRFRAQMDDHEHVFTVVGIDGDSITVDGNHPLAGMPLNFDVMVVEVREATDEELSHGHAHSADGHGH